MILSYVICTAKKLILNSILKKIHKNIWKCCFFVLFAWSGGFFQARAPKLLHYPIFWSYWAKKWVASSIPYDDLFSYPLSYGDVLVQYSKLKFDMVLYFGLINCPTVAKIFSCKNGFLSLICIKLTRDTALKPISLDLLENSTPLWYINKLNFDCFYRFYNFEIFTCIEILCLKIK